MVALTIGMLVGPKPAHAADFTVNSMADAADSALGNGVCDAGPVPVGGVPECTLRAAMEEANANGQADTIGFAPALSGTITLALGQLLVANDTPTTADLSINGPGAGRIAVSGNGASRVFYVAGGANATIGGLTIKNGNSSEGYGGGIYNGYLSTLTLNNSTVSANTTNYGGGGITNGGTLTLNNSTVSANQSSSYGGGIRSSNDLTGS
jgi:CSLREA domain-containing protein